MKQKYTPQEIATASGIKTLTWGGGAGTKINVLRVLEGPDKWGLIRIEYRLMRGRKCYRLWCHPSDLI